jgi:hypothetical protein
MSLDFAGLWDSYPTGAQDELFKSLGGGWPALIGAPAYENTCALRLSVAMLSMGEAPPADLASKDGNLKTGGGRPLIVRVPTARVWLERLLGPSTWGTSKSIGADIAGLIPPWRGILVYRVPNGTDASGHVDLWNQTICRKDCHSNFALSATTVELWKMT